MTTPNERTRALCQAGELLRELQQRRDIPDDISARLEGVMRHYPEQWQRRLMAEGSQCLGDWSFGLASEPDGPDPLSATKQSP